MGLDRLKREMAEVREQTSAPFGVDQCHRAGVLVMSMCGEVRHAVAAVEAGCASCATTTQFFEQHSEEVTRFPDQIGRSMNDGAMHLGAAPETDSIDPAKERYSGGQGLGGIHEIVPAADLVVRFVEEAERELDRLTSLRSPAFR